MYCVNMNAMEWQVSSDDGNTTAVCQEEEDVAYATSQSLMARGKYVSVCVIDLMVGLPANHKALPEAATAVGVCLHGNLPVAIMAQDVCHVTVPGLTGCCRPIIIFRIECLQSWHSLHTKYVILYSSVYICHDHIARYDATQLSTPGRAWFPG